MKHLSVAFVLIALVGCSAPSARLTFPDRPLKASHERQWFDVNHDGRNDFAVTFDDAGHVDALEYDDNEDGTPDRIYHLRDYATDRVPHLIILLDSVPFRCVAERWEKGEFRWFDGPPAKVIAPFPSLTEICYTELLHAPPMPGMIDQYYDRQKRVKHNGLWSRAMGGYRYPWEQQLDYRSKFTEEGFAYLNPKPWYQAELERARRALNESPNRVTIVYLTSASGMACKYGRDGIDEVLDGASRLCLQLLYERHGALKISMMADHGHNLMASKNIDIEKLLKPAGFHVNKRLDKPNDVVLEVNGLVTYAGVCTSRPSAVADRLLTHPGIELAMYMERDHIVVRDVNGSATIDSDHAGRLRYRTLTADVLGYEPVLGALRSAGKMDADGFASRADWFAAAVDHSYPDAPSRLWAAFHECAVNPPDVMFTTHDGYCAGLPEFERFITICSTHGSLNQINSATFLMTMTGRTLEKVLPTRDVMKSVEPTWQPRPVQK